jgi:tetratricopeptide (TPR) repeat protein
MAITPEFHDESALLDRLSTALIRRPQEVIFLVGAPLSSPIEPGKPGVPGVAGVIELIRNEFGTDPDERAALMRELNRSGQKMYQAAFSFLQGRRGQQTANEIVCRAVLAARKDTSKTPSIDFKDQAVAESICRTLEADQLGWHLNPGTEALGKLVAQFPAQFGKTILTTNFDPLVETAIRRAGGQFYKTILHSDGNLGQTEAAGCHVVHLHGFWLGTDTLHTSRQLGQPRPHLKDSLRSLLRNKVIVALAYGGWDDVFTEALMDVVRDINAYPEVIWTFHSATPNPPTNVIERLEAGIDRARVNLYSGTDCNSFLPRLYDKWLALEPQRTAPPSTQSNPVRVREALSEEVQGRTNEQMVIEGDDQDVPPVVDIVVGRDRELAIVQQSDAKAVFLTGVGGQGKSTVAATYYSVCQSERRYTYYVWRDCKEESERFENQLSSVIEKLSGGRVAGEDLAKQSTASIVEILMQFLKDKLVMFVFDNVDHYVDLETTRMTGAANIFVDSLLASSSKSQAVFTCRPEVTYDHPNALNMHLEGISLDAAAELFAKREARSSLSEIEEAHELTKGHAFWLDLLAIQVGKQNSPTDLSKLVSEIGSGTELEEKTLNSIWKTLRDREQTVLRAMAESVRPSTEGEIAGYVTEEMNYNKAARSLRNLRTLNLVVVKERPNAPNLMELHPLLRKFIRRNFAETERIGFINRVIRAYQKFIGINRRQLEYRPSLLILQNWTQTAELDVSARRYEDAFSALAEVSGAFIGSAYPREFTRAARILFDGVDWVTDYQRFKGFEDVFRTYAHLLEELGRGAEADALLEQYELTVPNRDARYIHYCNMRCYSKWFRGDFATAVKWGKIGEDLKTSSGVDTKYDVSHNLSLAQRDAGRPEVALPTFLSGKNLSEIVDPNELDEKRDGHYYGNIGRCLHLMGQADSALTCYQKSALLLERARVEHVVNQGYIRSWVAELLVAREQITLAYVFYRAAYLKWQQAAPPRASRVKEIAQQFRDRVSESIDLEDSSVEGIWIDWMLGENVDKKFG